MKITAAQVRTARKLEARRKRNIKYPPWRFSLEMPCVWVDHEIDLCMPGVVAEGA